MKGNQTIISSAQPFLLADYRTILKIPTTFTNRQQLIINTHEWTNIGGQYQYK